jgi:hypothetical protein
MALSCATVIIVGGVLAETRSQVVAERQRIDQLTDMMVATSLMMQASQEERNADLASRVSTIATAISARVGNAETCLDELVLRLKRVDKSQTQLKRNEANAAQGAG